VTHAASPHWLAFKQGAAQNWLAFASVKQQLPLPQLVKIPLHPWYAAPSLATQT
jgi:hypothetical protein